MFVLQLVVAGISLGAVYALIAQGFNVTFLTTKVVNFAHGSFLMICAMFSLSLLSRGFPAWLALLVGIAVTAGLGMLVERISIRPLMRYPSSMGWIVSTLGVGIVLQAVATELWGAQAVAFPAIIFSSTDYVHLFGVQLSAQYLLVFVVAGVVMAVLELGMNKTTWGKAMKAVSHDVDCARVFGIPAKGLRIFSFVLSALLGGIAGLLVAPITGLDPAFGMDLMIKGFVAAVIGGLGSSKGAFIGGLILGLVEMLCGGYVSTSMANGVAFAILMIALVVWPKGLFGHKEVVKA